MNGNFRIDNWLHNVRHSVDSLVHDFVHVAEDLAHNFQPAPASTNTQTEAEAAAAAVAPSPESQRAPPASIRAIRRLPTIRVAPEDLVDPSNRECCICLEENSLDEKVTRLPCAHIFHSECILDWLTNHHCTCPVCRYELPTENPLYEAGRTERMKTRKPRYAMYELQRMSIPELLALHRRPVLGGVEKKDLFQTLIDEERIQIIPAPEPVEYDLETLQAMRISELKRAMEDAGVFFHSKDVVEKSDMVTIFKNSGRLNLLPSVLPSSTDESKPASTTPQKRPLVETVEDSDGDDEADTDVVDESLPPPQEMFGSEDGELASRGLVAESAPQEVSEQTHTTSIESSTPPTNSASSITESVPPTQEVSSGYLQQDYQEGAMESTTQRADYGTVPVDSSFHNRTTEEIRAEPLQERFPVDIPPPVSSPTPMSVDGLEPDQHCDQSHNTSYTDHSTERQFQDCSITQLQAIGREANVDLSSCLELSEMVDLLVQAGATSQIVRGNFSDWSVSQLRALASEVNIDLSQCADRGEMLNRILLEANTERPHLQTYLRALSPLATSSISALRGIAREWGVNINDCLEKEEIITRLISRGRTFGVC